jgi:hypothetical protein
LRLQGIEHEGFFETQSHREHREEEQRGRTERKNGEEERRRGTEKRKNEGGERGLGIKR